MNNATATNASGDRAAAPATKTETIKPEEAKHFGALAADWWNPAGSSAMLHKLNPVRLSFIRKAIDGHFGGDPRAVRPLSGKHALDAGCGAGLLCEPLARLGAQVTGVDAAEENIVAARAHAEAMGLLSPLPSGGGAGSGEGLSGTITYHHGELGALGLKDFDLVCSLEVIEHVADKGRFIHLLAEALAPGGLMILSCPNRTVRSRLLLVEAAERLGQVPRGTHTWGDFVTPEELRDLLSAAGLEMGEPKGISWSPASGLHLSADLSLNYIVTAAKVP